MDMESAGNHYPAEGIFRRVADLEAFFEGLAVIDRQKRILYSNCAAAAAYGYASWRDLVGREWQALCDDRELKRFEEEIIPLTWEQGRWRGESVGRRRDGSRFHHEAFLTAVDGERIVILIRDLTEQARTRAECFSLRRAVDNMQIGVTIADMHRKILYVNPSEAEMHGYGVEELIGRDVRRLAPPDRWAPLDPARLTRHFTRETVNVRKDGTLFPVQLMSDYVADAEGRAVNIVTTCEDISRRKISEDTMRHRIYYDDLTDLPNRTFFNERLEQAVARARDSGKLIAVMVLDLDRFRTINDSLDHDAGDHLIYAVAQRLQREVRGGGQVARLGGDEFLIMLPDLGRPHDAIIRAQRIMRAVSQAFVLSGRELFVTASIGISMYPSDGDDVPTLIKNADTAMYYVKGQGRNNYHLYSPAMNARNLENLTMENNLRKALPRQELLVHYQPQYDLGTGAAVSVEALLRWEHPSLGLVPPAAFIPLAEETGLIIPIGEWLLQTACSQLMRWGREGVGLQRIAVNLSMRQFRLTNLVETVGTTLQRTGLHPGSLELELTESIIMQDPELTVAILRELSAMGLSLSIDDFGTGYSSLNYLKYLPIHKLKIAPNFAAGIGKDPNDEAIAKAIIGMAHSLNMRVIAEGVETAEQLSFLRAHQCDEVQGYLFSKPLPADGVAALLAAP